MELVLDMGETPGSNPPGTAPHQDPKLERPGSACIIRPRSSAKSPRGGAATGPHVCASIPVAQYIINCINNSRGRLVYVDVYVYK